jgi:K+-transporting ATPase ATPase B chain
LIFKLENPRFIKFTAETRSSGIDFENTRIRKGASDAIKKLCEKAGNVFPSETAEQVKKFQVMEEHL